ncbi:SH3 domain-containing protein C23A1.17 [Daldinia childiae]|uniref:SH3 domain-containing protein C23A1.17 n=1 Tax=Daldinia childiae TaxID=326645 RepID=UPI0014480CAD|nr:SH3 domain-containing protein C23A1.17 [Daldinia childiae]KAF3061530.1 SH3 domain-containing protein C23A1.17 [Daldinia childiae]
MAAVPFKVKAIYEYTSSHEDDLPFGIGQIITVTDNEEDDWYGGEYVDDLGVRREGIFPRNFVEKYEPTAPPRPTRTRKKEAEAPSSPPPPPTAAPSSPPPVEEPADIPSEVAYGEPRVASPPIPVPAPRSPPAPVAPVAKPPEPAPIPAPVPVQPRAFEPASPRVAAPPVSKSPAPGPARAAPPVSEKPGGNSFRDRIAAFNKPAAPPVAPFKPGNLSSGSSGFIKKPFVAPPPSRNAFVPPPRDVPTAKVYRRDEDPEIKATEAESLESAEKAGLVPAGTSEGQAEDVPKPTSLKERIALLQKQQAEAAQRHAEAVAKKEKPKRPQKKRTESEEGTPADEAAEAPPPLERKDTAEVASKKSMDEPRPPRLSISSRRRSSAARPENDGNEADMSGAGDTTEGQEDLTEKEDSDEKSRPHRGTAAEPEIPEDREGEEGQEEDVDPEVRRKEELRARMAKMSGGMGFHGMFGPPGMMPVGGPAIPKKPKASPPSERRSSEIQDRPSSPRMSAPPVPTLMALPGMGKPKQEEEEAAKSDHDEPGEQDITPVVSAQPTGSAPERKFQPRRVLCLIMTTVRRLTRRSALSNTSSAPPPVPGSRPAPPPVPTDSRPLPTGVTSPSQGSESDDELSENPQRALETPRSEAPPAPIASPTMPTSPRIPNRPTSYMGEQASPTSPPVPSKRNSRPPPPIPGGAPPPPIQSRPPPPPPPGGPLSRSSTADERIALPMRPGTLDNGEEGEVTEYEGDYDTDIASSVPHKDALKSHARDSSFDDNTSLRSPVTDIPPLLPPPVPSAAAPRAGPPPLPSQPPPGSRGSIDVPRAAPPPPPPKEASFNDDDYDPFNYNAAQSSSAAAAHSLATHDEPTPTPQSASAYHSPPPPPPVTRGPPPAPPVNRAPPRKSLDVQRPGGRRSVDASRPSMETGYVANEIDLAGHTQWWLSPTGLPPVFQGRPDIYTECDESTSGTSVTKEVFILFQDYSQTVVTVHFDSQNPADVQLEQRHEAPPRSLRQDELEGAYEQFGRALSSAVATKKDSVVGDGSPWALILELLKPLKGVLLPVGRRGYGALVYANLANASTQLNDEIRPGDIISIRNAKFQGKHGPMHAKYTMEVGKPDHVAIVAEWDGTKKKVRAWEQGRESKKVKQESFKLEDLRSGEVKIWRVMPRSWVGWSSD